MKYIIHALVLVMLCLSANPSVLFAATGSGLGSGNTAGSGLGTCTGICLENPIQAESFTELFQAIIDIVLVFAIPVVVFFIVLAGFKYVTARGNETTIKQAHMALLYALIGGVLILGARVLIEVISGTVDAIKG